MLVDISQSSPTITNQRARLVSQTIIPNGEQCVEFWYYTDAEALSSASKLNLFVRTTAQQSNSSGYLIWSKNILNVSCFYIKDKEKEINFKILRNVNGVFHNNVFHRVLFYHHIKLHLKV